jgi:hypothetical protein
MYRKFKQWFTERRLEALESNREYYLWWMKKLQDTDANT